jgi:hypothetical protein
MTRAPDHPKLLARINFGRDEVWTRDSVLVVVPAILEQYPEPLIESISRRRALLLGGRCDCGIRLPASAVDMCSQGNDVVIWHEPDCTARDAERLMAEWIASGEARRQ